MALAAEWGMAQLQLVFQKLPWEHFGMLNRQPVLHQLPFPPQAVAVVGVAAAVTVSVLTDP